MNNIDKKIIKVLEEKKILNIDHQIIEKELKEGKLDLKEYLISKGYITEKEFLGVIASVTRYPIIDLNEDIIDKDIIKNIPVRFVWHYIFMPLKIENNKLIIAVDRPLDIKTKDELHFHLGYEIEIVLTSKDKLLEYIKKFYGLGSDTLDKISSNMVSEDNRTNIVFTYDIEDIGKDVSAPSIIKLVNDILLDAYKKRATDIHIEPFRDKVFVRYRIDGVLYDQKLAEDFNKYIGSILSRIKIMANLNIVEKRLPQDGRAIVKIGQQMLDLRISSIPTPNGESMVIRILPTKMLFDLEKLGLSFQDLKLVEQLISKNSGIIFVTGPTGSGKTTTLYAFLRRMNNRMKKIITIEDPLEYEMDGITQIQVNNEVGLTFSRGLRSILRHDPDIIMVGEVRDKETAEIAIRLALTGHLILSTLHTNDAPGGITRLLDIGIEPYLVASSVISFIAQRLVRVLCNNCKEEYIDMDLEIKKLLFNQLGLDIDEQVKIFKNKGCEECSFTGFYGRTAIYEILVVDEIIKDFIMRRISTDEIKREAIKRGMRTLFYDGLCKVREGITTPEEVFRVCDDIQMIPKRIKDTETVENKELLGIPKERRLFLRRDIELGFRYKIIKRGEEQFLYINKEKERVEEYEGDVDGYKECFVTTKDISAGGMKFESIYKIPLDSILDIAIEFPEINKLIRCLGKVVRIEDALPKCFYISLCFLDLSSADRKFLEDYIEKIR